jgi:hypothetical protein
MKQVALLLFVFSLSISISWSNASVKTNKNIIDSILTAVSHQFLSQLQTTGLKELKMTAQDNSNDYFLNFTLQKILDNSKIQLENTKDEPYPYFKFFVSNFEIKYEDISNLIERTIVFDISIFQVEKDGSIKEIVSSKNTYKDKISDDNFPYIEDNNFPFTKGKFPPTKKSFFDEILEPVIVITASVLSVFLFFSVRSK